MVWLLLDDNDDLWTRSRETTSLYQTICFLLKLLRMIRAAAVEAEAFTMSNPLKTSLLTLIRYNKEWNTIAAFVMRISTHGLAAQVFLLRKKRVRRSRFESQPGRTYGVLILEGLCLKHTVVELMQ